SHHVDSMLSHMIASMEGGQTIHLEVELRDHSEWKNTIEACDTSLSGNNFLHNPNSSPDFLSTHTQGSSDWRSWERAEKCLEMSLAGFWWGRQRRPCHLSLSFLPLHRAIGCLC